MAKHKRVLKIYRRAFGRVKWGPMIMDTQHMCTSLTKELNPNDSKMRRAK